VTPSTAGLLAMVTLFGVIEQPVAGQSLWTEASTLGYGATAVGLTIGACWSSCGFETAEVGILAAGIGGFVLGHRIGGSAEGAARRRERLSAAQLWGARIGTVTGFAAIGALVAAIIVNETGGNAEGEDERRLATYTLLGAGAGVLVEVWQESGLPTETEAALKKVVVHPASGGTVRIGFRSRVAW